MAILSAYYTTLGIFKIFNNKIDCLGYRKSLQKQILTQKGYKNMLKDEIVKYQISEYITLKVIRTKLFGMIIKFSCYLIDKEGNIKKII